MFICFVMTHQGQDDLQAVTHLPSKPTITFRLELDYARMIVQTKAMNSTGQHHSDHKG